MDDVWVADVTAIYTAGYSVRPINTGLKLTGYRKEGRKKKKEKRADDVLSCRSSL